MSTPQISSGSAWKETAKSAPAGEGEDQQHPGSLGKREGWPCRGHRAGGADQEPAVIVPPADQVDGGGEKAKPGSDAVEMMPDGERIVAERQQVRGQQDRDETVPEIAHRAGGMEPALGADARAAAGSTRGLAALRSGRMRSGHRTSKLTDE